MTGVQRTQEAVAWWQKSESKVGNVVELRKKQEGLRKERSNNDQLMLKSMKQKGKVVCWEDELCFLLLQKRARPKKKENILLKRELLHLRGSLKEKADAQALVAHLMQIRW